MSEAGPSEPTDHNEGDGDEWYAAGLRFECTQCGNCCTGPPGYVWFTEEEGRAMAAAMDLSEEDFLEQYARRVRRRWTLKEIDAKDGYDCIFLDRVSEPGKALCGVYDARPSQCRSWPFWPEMLESERAWELARRTTPCPGMNTGPLIRIEDIRIRRDATS